MSTRFGWSLKMAEVDTILLVGLKGAKKILSKSLIIWITLRR